MSAPFDGKVSTKRQDWTYNGLLYVHAGPPTPSGNTRTPNAYYDILSVLGRFNDISLGHQCSAPLPFFADRNVAILGDAVGMERTSNTRTIWSRDAIVSSFPGLQAHTYYSHA